MNFDMGRGLEPGHHTDSKSLIVDQQDRDYSNSCFVDMLTCGNFQQMDGSTQQQQIEIDRMLAIVTSCCPENDTYNAESFVKQKTHFQDQDDPKPDVKPKKSKSPRRPPTSDSDMDSSTNYSSSSSDNSYRKRSSKKPKKGRKRSKSPVMPKKK
jgi:hypothetical protein